jgi:hypothetical protein
MTATPQWLRSIQAETADNPGPHSRRDGWGSFREVHGRLRLDTPEELTPVDAEPWKPPHGWQAVSEGVQAQGLVKDAKRRARLAVVGLGLVGLAVVAALFAGCAHEPVATPKPPAVVVLSERVGSATASLIETATGQRPFAVSAPYLPIIVLSPKDADDRGLIAHEECHKRQEHDLGEIRWAALYVRDLADCERMAVERGVCLKTIPLEAECYQVQREIAMEGARP